MSDIQRYKITAQEYYNKAIFGTEAGGVIEENHLKMTVLKVLKNFHEVNSRDHIKEMEAKDMEIDNLKQQVDEISHESSKTISEQAKEIERLKEELEDVTDAMNKYSDEADALWREKYD